MRFNVLLEDENGVVTERVEDPKGLLYHVLPEQANSEFHYLPYIDRFGNTVFNHPQIEPLPREWEHLLVECRDVEVATLAGRGEATCNRLPECCPPVLALRR